MNKKEQLKRLIYTLYRQDEPEDYTDECTAVGRIIPPRSTGVPNAAQAVHTAAMTMPIMLTTTATAYVMAAGVK